MRSLLFVFLNEGGGGDCLDINIPLCKTPPQLTSVAGPSTRLTFLLSASYSLGILIFAISGGFPGR